MIPPGNPMYPKAALLMAEINDKRLKSGDTMKDAERFLKAGDLINGMKDIRTAALICPGCQEPYSRMKTVYLQAVTKANELYMDGINQYTQGNVKGAIDLWEKVIVLTPSNQTGIKAADNIKKAKTKLKMLREM